MGNIIQKELNTIYPRDGAEEKMLTAIFNKAQNEELVAELHAGEKRTSRKAPVAVAASLAAVVGGAALIGIVGKNLPVAENPEAETAVMISIDGNGSEYRSTDNGESWLLDGRETDDAPEIYFTAEDISAYSFDRNNPVLTVHNNSDTSIFPSPIKRLDILENGEWLPVELAADFITDSFEMVVGGDVYQQEIPLDLILPKNGRYRCYLEDDETDWVCMAEFTAVREYDADVYSVWGRTGKKYESFDNGRGWFKDGSKADCPPVFLTMQSAAQLPSDRNSFITVHNNYNHFTDDTVSINHRIEVLKNGEWAVAESLPDMENTPFSVGTALTVELPITKLSDKSASYRYVAEIAKDTENSTEVGAEFSLNADNEVPTTPSVYIVVTADNGDTYYSDNNGYSWAKNGTETEEKPPFFISGNIGTADKTDNALFTVHNLSGEDIKISREPKYLNTYSGEYDFVTDPFYNYETGGAVIPAAENGIGYGLWKHINPDTYIYVFSGEKNNQSKNAFSVSIESGYTCTIQINSEAYKKEEPSYDPVIHLVQPDLSGFLSYDGGNEWYRGGEVKIETLPEVYATTNVRGETDFSENPVITLFNNSDTDITIKSVMAYRQYRNSDKTDIGYKDTVIPAKDKYVFFMPLKDFEPQTDVYCCQIVSNEGHSIIVDFFANAGDYDNIIDVPLENPKGYRVIARYDTDEIMNELFSELPIDITTLDYYDKMREEYSHEAILEYIEYKFNDVIYIGSDKADYIGIADWYIRRLDSEEEGPPPREQFYSKMFYIKDGKIADVFYEGSRFDNSRIVLKDKMYYDLNSINDKEPSGIYCIDYNSSEPTELVTDKNSLYIVDADEKYLQFVISSIAPDETTHKVLNFSTGEIIDSDYHQFGGDGGVTFIDGDTYYFPCYDPTEAAGVSGYDLKYYAFNLLTGTRVLTDMNYYQLMESLDKETEQHTAETDDYYLDTLHSKYDIYGAYSLYDYASDEKLFSLTDRKTGEVKYYSLPLYEYDYCLGAVNGKFYFTRERLIEFDPETEKATPISGNLMNIMKCPLHDAFTADPYTYNEWETPYHSSIIFVPLD